MRVSCPTCQTEYDVPDAALAGRVRKLRCVTCGAQWEAGPLPAPEPVPVPIPAPAPESIPAPTAAELEYMRRPRAAVPANVSYGEPQAVEAPSLEQNFPPPAKVSRAEAPARLDPAELRHQADRESFAALLEASRKPGSQNPDAAAKYATVQARKMPNPWLISVLILLLGAGLIFLEREHIMAAWPPSIRFFAAVGLR